MLKSTLGGGGGRGGSVPDDETMQVRAGDGVNGLGGGGGGGQMDTQSNDGVGGSGTVMVRYLL